MKSRMFSLLGSVLILVLFKSLPCMAQAEIVPDHFDEFSALSFEQTAGVQTIAAGNPASFQGRFTLLHEIHCQGKTLPAGTYSLSILPREGWNLVTFTPQGAAGNMQMRMKSSPGSRRSTALILESVGGQSVLTGISLQKAGRVLYPETAPSQPISPESELVPIHSPTRTRGAK